MRCFWLASVCTGIQSIDLFFISSVLRMCVAVAIKLDIKQYYLRPDRHFIQLHLILLNVPPKSPSKGQQKLHQKACKFRFEIGLLFYIRFPVIRPVSQQQLKRYICNILINVKHLN